MSEDLPHAAEMTIGTCQHGIYINMLDEKGRVICHGHGFDAVAVYRLLGEMIAEHGLKAKGDA